MKLYVAIPAVNESEYIGKTIDCIRNQKAVSSFEVVICVNQPESFWHDKEKRNICEDNHKTISYLNSIKDFPLTIIDKSSKGKGWKKDSYGVGWARKVVMDAINLKAEKDDIILSLDADTVFNENYFSSIIDSFALNPEAVAISVPYYHKLTKSDIINGAILRYEIYMRYYLLNLLRIKSPYSFTALGSAIALPVRTYRAIRGITPNKSGEDFYFLQKLCKYGKVLIHNDECVYPSARFSDRVFFGTGPALIKGSLGDWKSYPIYNYKLFDNIHKTYSLFPELYLKDIETPMSEFLEGMFKTTDLWSALRTNCTNEQGFIRACYTKIDALRILQYLKVNQMGTEYSDESNLCVFLNKFYNEETTSENLITSGFSFMHSSIDELDKIRNFMFNTEMSIRKTQLFNS